MGTLKLVTHKNVSLTKAVFSNPVLGGTTQSNHFGFIQNFLNLFLSVELNTNVIVFKNVHVALFHLL